MTEEWQTDLRVFSVFPYRCAHFWSHPEEITWDAYDDQTAFYCPLGGSYRIIEEECWGDECPHCKLVGHEDYLRLIGGCGGLTNPP